MVVTEVAGLTAETTIMIIVGNYYCINNNIASYRQALF